MTDAAQLTQDEIAAQLEALRAEIEELKAEKQQLREENEDLRERVSELESQPEFEIRDENDPIKSLRVEGAPLGKAIQSKPGESDVESRLEELKADLQQAEDTADVDARPAGHPRPETPLEQVVAMPDQMADIHLTANEDRARFVASDVRDYAASVQAGWAITSSDLRRVLAAYDSSGHTETTSRVMSILDDLGGDAVKIVETNGTRRVVFTDELVARLNRLDDVPDSHSVVSAVE
ncbi:hypothetical protein [Haloarchaeobius sp. HME9146]|uniref:hypothetical protein n=1 Tax=Haloarchaeobius sp. HME9146 TaxID=2978732 RepID=UPI0021C2039A|nr:hypothetical protein [Haloarchaeobius sp. HME9146]MCT9098509.1 hypothetical protein [Haloarchaeobius sp. HME9146]